jgi:hypothetical protein
MPRDAETTPDLTEVISGGMVSRKALELEGDSGFADRMGDGALGLASLELGDGGPAFDEHLEPLPADIRADQVQDDAFDPAADADLTDGTPPVDLQHLDGNLRGAGTADLRQLRNGGERAAAVSDAAAGPEEPLTAGPLRTS